MKKRMRNKTKHNLLPVVTVLCLMLSLTGCSKDENRQTAATETGSGQAAQTETTDTAQTDGQETEAQKEPETRAAVEKEPYDASRYVNLGEYKGIQVSGAEIAVDDDTLESVLASQLAQQSYQQEVTDRPVQEGDTVNIDYKGMKDGEAFAGGTAQGYDLTIGSGSFIPGFEDGLIGVEAGQTVNLDLTFPDPYDRNPDLAGQPVVFEVTVNSITETITPELTDEYAAQNSEYATAEEYRENLREVLMEQNKKSAVLDALIAQAQFETLPENLMAYYEYDMIQQASYQAAMYGMNYETFLSAMGMDEEAFLGMSAEDITANARQDVVLEAVIAAEGLELTEEEFQAGTAELAESYGTTAENVISVLGEDLIRENLLWNKAIDLIADAAVVTE